MLRPSVLLCCLGIAPLALADVTLHYEGGGGDTAISTMHIGDGRARMDMGDNSVIFDTSRDAMLTLDHARKRYTLLDRAALEELRSGLDDAMRQMREAMANVPPEMRQQMEKMMGDKIPGMGGKIEIVMEPSGRNGEVAGYACRYVQTRVGAQMVQETCLAKANDLGFTSTELATLEAIAEMGRKMAESMSQGLAASGLSLQMPMQGDEVPIEVIDPNSRRGSSKLSSVSREPIADALFQTPSGYREQKIEMPRR